VSPDVRRRAEHAGNDNVRRLPRRASGPGRRDRVEAGAPLLAELHAALCRYVVFPSAETADAVALWVAATHAQPAWEHAPRLAVVSPLKRCGKSRLVDVVAETCHEPLITVNATIAAIVRAIGQDPPTLLVDEADTLWGSRKQADNNEELRGLLNAGHQRNRPMLRWDITTRTLDRLDTFAMAMLASIGDLPDTIMDRAVVVRMRRRSPGEQVAPYRTRRDAPALHELRERLTAWARSQVDELEHAAPAMPLEDRAADTWEPLIAIADLAGADWPQRARAAAGALAADAAEQDQDSSVGLRLLVDLRTVFADDDRLDSKTALDRLCRLEESPWDDLRGKRLDARGLSKLLRPYGIKPKVIRFGEATPRGYERADFADAWRRYLPQQPQHEQQQGETAGQDRCGPPEESRNTSATGARVADALHHQDSIRNGSTSDVADVAPVADPLGAGDTHIDDGWLFGQPMTPCAVCATGTTNRAPDGRPLHVLCAHRDGIEV
jgi:Protein of unknown function (DUF3631)